MFPSVIVLLFANCFLVSFGTPTFDPSVPITSRDIQLRCCNNHWEVCCKNYSGMEVNSDQEGSAFSDTEGSTEVDSSYCQRYSSRLHYNYFGDKCLNNYLLFRDMRVTRNLIEELHRCSAVKDYEFINATLKIGQRMRSSGLHCCSKYQQGVTSFGIFYLKLLILKDLAELQKKYYLQHRLPRIPCINYGDTKTIEHRLSEQLWKMGAYLTCAEELAC